MGRSHGFQEQQRGDQSLPTGFKGVLKKIDHIMKILQSLIEGQ